MKIFGVFVISSLMVACFSADGKTITRSPSTAHNCPDNQSKPLPPSIQPLIDPDMQFFYSPPNNPSPADSTDIEGHQRWINAIQGAKTSVLLTVYHLTDLSVINALIQKQKDLENNLHAAVEPSDLTKGVHIIVDPDFYNNKSPAIQDDIQMLKAANVDIQPGDKAFSITHMKSMIIDESTAFVTSMNLTTAQFKTRDMGIVTHDQDVISEMNKVFTFDHNNLNINTDPNNPQEPKDLPARSSLVWSPINSENKLISLIQSSSRSLKCTTESLTDPKIMQAFECAKSRGVDVQVITPQFDEAPPPCMNWDHETAMNTAAGSEISRLMPGRGTANSGSTPGIPYIHQKMCLSDYNTDTGGTAYVGSVNLSNNSTQHARELGIIFQNKAAGAQMNQIFSQDWGQSISVPDAGTEKKLCAPPKSKNTPGQTSKPVSQLTK